MPTGGVAARFGAGLASFAFSITRYRLRRFGRPGCVPTGGVAARFGAGLGSFAFGITRYRLPVASRPDIDRHLPPVGDLPEAAGPPTFPTTTSPEVGPVAPVVGPRTTLSLETPPSERRRVKPLPGTAMSTVDVLLLVPLCHPATRPGPGRGRQECPTTRPDSRYHLSLLHDDLPPSTEFPLHFLLPQKRGTLSNYTPNAKPSRGSISTRFRCHCLVLALPCPRATPTRYRPDRLHQVSAGSSSSGHSLAR